MICKNQYPIEIFGLEKQSGGIQQTTIKLDNVHPEGCCFIVCPDLVRSVQCPYLSIDVLWLFVFCGSYSWCCGLVCSVWLWYFLIILTYFFFHTNPFFKKEELGQISRQILVLSEHTLFTLKGTWNIPILYCKSLDNAYLSPFLTVSSQVGLQSVIVAFLGHTLSVFETIIIVDDNTIVLHKIELQICSSLNKLKMIW